MEVQTIMSKQGERINNEELKEIIREADLDGDGFINFQGIYAMSNTNLLLECVCTVSVSFTKLRIVDNEVATQKICHKLS